MVVALVAVMLVFCCLNTGTSVVINEVMVSNYEWIQDPQGDYDDWIEIYNAGDEAIDIGGMYLTDRRLNPDGWWQIPEDSPETTIPAGGYLLIWADGDTGDSPGLHANFKLSASGEEIILFDARGNLIDNIIFDTQLPDVSYGRYPDASNDWRVFDIPTPREGNIIGRYLGIVAPPELNHNRGFYETSLNVAITCETEGATIYYTLDGSEPNETSMEYTNPIPINSTACLRVRAFRNDWLPSTIKTHTWLINESEAIKSLPVLSIVGDEEEALYEPNGIMAIVGGHYDEKVWVPDGPNDYNNPMQRGREYERPVSVELINSDGSAGFQSDCGIRVRGSRNTRPRYRRSDDWFTGSIFNKFSFNLYFRSIYGESRLEYPLFSGSQVDRLKCVVLRAGKNDQRNPFIKDELVRRLHTDMGAVASSGRMVNLFINGEYKGYYNLCERIDEEFLQEWYGKDEDWDVLPKSGLRDGDKVAWNALLDYVRNHDLSDDAHYQEVGRRLDITAFIDYLILELYIGREDFPVVNWTVARERSDEGKFRFYIWDVEQSMRASGLHRVGFNELPGFQGGQDINGKEPPIGWLYRALKANDDFRLVFADRIQEHFYNDGALTNANITDRFLELRSEMSGVLPNMDMFILDTFIPERRDIILNAFAQEGLSILADTEP